MKNTPKHWQDLTNNKATNKTGRKNSNFFPILSLLMVMSCSPFWSDQRYFHQRQIRETTRIRLATSESSARRFLFTLPLNSSISTQTLVPVSPQTAQMFSCLQHVYSEVNIFWTVDQIFPLCFSPVSSISPISSHWYFRDIFKSNQNFFFYSWTQHLDTSIFFKPPSRLISCHMYSKQTYIQKVKIHFYLYCDGISTITHKIGRCKALKSLGFANLRIFALFYPVLFPRIISSLVPYFLGGLRWNRSFSFPLRLETICFVWTARKIQPKKANPCGWPFFPLTLACPQYLAPNALADTNLV